MDSSKKALSPYGKPNKSLLPGGLGLKLKLKGFLLSVGLPC